VPGRVAKQLLELAGRFGDKRDDGVHVHHDLTQEDRSYVVLFADLDHFKDLNDVHGHEIGDRALRLFARVVRDSVRPKDIPARYGGEEFVIVLPDCTVGDACIVAERVQARLLDAIGTAAVPPGGTATGMSAG